MAISLVGARPVANLGEATYAPELAAELANTPPPNASKGPSFDSLWMQHLGNLAAQAPEMPGDGGGFRLPTNVREDIQRSEDTAISNFASESKQTPTVVKRKLGARDAVTVGGLFFGAPQVAEGAGLAGAVLGGLGRISTGAGVAGAAGLAEGALGGYKPEETATMGRDYAMGGAAISAGLEGLGLAAGAIGAGLRTGAKFKELAKAFEDMNLEPRSVDEHASGIASTGELPAAEALDAQHTALREQALQAVQRAARFVRGHTKRIGRADMNNPEVYAWAVQKLRDAGHDIPDQMAGDLVWEALRNTKTKLPVKMVRPTSKIRQLATPVGTEARTVFDMTVGLPDIGTHYYQPASIAKGLRAARSVARTAAAERLQEAMDIGYALNADAGLRISGPKAGSAMQIVWNGTRVGLQRVADVLRDETIFGKAGAGLADAIHSHVQLADAMIGHNKRIVDAITQHLKPQELYELDEVLRWGKQTTNPRVEKAAARWVSLRQMFAEDTHKLGIHTKDRGLTARYSRLKEAQRRLVDNALKSLEDLTAPNQAAELQALVDQMDDKAHGIFTRMRDLDAVVEHTPGGEVHVIRPFRESGLNAPDYYDPKLLQAVRDDENHPIYKMLRARVLNEYPDMVNPHTGIPYDEIAVRKTVHELLGAASSDAPEDIRRNSLQWSREAILPPEWRIADPRVWMNKYVHEASTRQSLAKVFGGRNEKLNALRNLLADETHTSLSHGGDFQPRGGDTHAEELFQNIFEMVAGGGPRTHKLVKDANTAATLFRLGFRTAFKQLPALGNSAATHGLGNTLDAMVSVLTNPNARRLADDVGATVPDLQHALEGDMAGELAQKHLRGTGIVLADRLTRRTSALAAGLKAASAARALRGLGSKSAATRLEAEQALRWFKRLSVDTDAIIQSGYTVPTEQLRQVMRAGARNTQFASQVEDLPYFNRESGGKLVLFLNKFSLQHGQFLKEEIFKEAARGNMKPLIALAVAAGVSDQTIGKLLELASKKDYDSTAEIIQDTFFGKVGQVAGDIWKDPKSAPQKLVTGPAFGLLGDFFTGAKDISEGQFPTTWLPATVRQTKNLWDNLNE